MARNAGTSTLAVFAITLFLSASVMFAVQPMVGKMLLPLVGGTPAGWIVAMAFFQIMLLVGYLLAHVLSAFTPRQQALLYVLALVAGSFFMPLSLSRGAAFTSTPGAWDVFLLLTFCVAVPFIALSATSSTIQRLFMVTKHGSSEDPYFLYAASNLGSFTGLLVYPFLIEPNLAIDAQAKGLYGGYALLMLFALVCAMMAGGREKKPAQRAANTALPPWKTMAEWAALAFVPSSLLMGVTTYITTDVISAPMIWIMPLALYLLTFVIAFAKHQWTGAQLLQKSLPVVVFVAICVISVMRFLWLGSWLGVLFYLGVFFVIALSCHLRFAALRPLGNSRHLTAYYLMMSVGGALGGVLNAFIVPYAVSRPLEFPLMLLGSLLLHPDFKAKSRGGMAFVASLILALLLVNLPPDPDGLDNVQGRTMMMYAIIFGAFVLLPVYKEKLLGVLPLALSATVILMVSQFVFTGGTELMRVRNFYGIIRLSDAKVEDKGKEYTVRSMSHGSTVHGRQVLDPVLSKEPTTYHVRTGPLGDLFRAYKPKKVAVLGLGIGVMNCYTAKDREFTYIEIDPDMVKVAEENFTFLSGCKSKKPPRIIVGDGRLELARLEGEKFDIVVVDVFTSDSIPTHLLTKEAFELYMKHLAPGGVVALHISNRYFSLRDTVAVTAATLGLQSVAGAATFKPKDMLFYASYSLWMAVAKKDTSFKPLPQPRWQQVADTGAARPWTDNYTDLFSTMHFLSKPGAAK